MCGIRLILLVTIVHWSAARIFNRCDLAKVLKAKHNSLSNGDIAIWVCIAQRQSGFDTEALGYDGDGNGYHGLFQISDQFWCSRTGRPNDGTSNVCRLPCDRLRDDDLGDDLRCIRTIFAEHARLSGDGFNAWVAYKTHCKDVKTSSISDCLPGARSNEVSDVSSEPINRNAGRGKSRGKVYTKCELARDLKFKYHMPVDQIPTWVCIAKHESNFDTSAVGRLNADGSEDHGLFQISDLYWCSPPGHGKACGVPCSQFEDSDITDDVRCIKKIFNEHQRLSGNGFNAWAVYRPYCKGLSSTYTKDCFTDNIGSVEAPFEHRPGIYAPSTSTLATNDFRKVDLKLSSGKVYDRCELAHELHFKHNLAKDQIATWVCIAKHESNFNTSAVGRLNADGSGDHGLFQISDIYWCSPPGKGWVCGLSCSKLEDSDITDDVECMKMIFEEHQRLFGDGFNAWTVYRPHCKSGVDKYIEGCFENENSAIKPSPVTSQNSFDEKDRGTPKIYDRCELATELRFQHNVPMLDISTWVCIAFYESSFNTSAIGKYNSDESHDHGLFQINDKYWCSPPGEGQACGISCDKLKDSNIADDVECIKLIHAEHQRLSGDGFNAWPVYQAYCKKSTFDFIEDCFTDLPKTLDNEKSFSKSDVIPSTSFTVKPTKGKVYEKCELAKELRYKHKIPMDQVANWVCIAKYQSNFNTSAVKTGEAGYHGIFQIGDIYWCSPPGMGWVCGLSCHKLEDSDITDDVECIKKIYEEHERISGDGFNAWSVYKTFCKGRSDSLLSECFDDFNSHKFSGSKNKPSPSPPRKSSEEISTGKVYQRCELAKELRFKHNVPMNQIANWVCIAKYQSGFNTSAVKNTEAGYHGIFQIGDTYWCSPPGTGKGCGLSCDKLEDSDIGDDVECVQRIYEEHQGISGDGFNAWSVYNTFCKGRSDSLVSDCFKELKKNIDSPSTSNKIPNKSPPANVPTGKVYERCELAKELRFTHNLPEDQIATWVCIAKHESSYNTSAIGRLNVDGSWDHGLFQISDIYWCSPPGKGWACGVTCEQLRDNDITDDIDCIKTIHEEHTRISGDGFNAWAVYNPYCKGRSAHYTEGCFDEHRNEQTRPYRSTTNTPKINRRKGKIFEKCELARDLLFKHNVPMNQIANWVCIAKYQSGFNTSAIKNAEAGYHGIFQIGDTYWCSPPGAGKGCGLSCDKLEDSDIGDDVECVQRIYEEHQGISGDGFNAWSVYNTFCKGKSDSLVSDCFDKLKNSGDSAHKLSNISSNKPSKPNGPTGKVYQRCELAKELRFKHNLPEDQIATWVCIAKHESSYNTSAIGRLNVDGSWDHGLFQISDIYWCSPPGKGWACGVTCEQLRDNDITDDIDCIKTIHEEHTRISGDGFNAWTVYKPHCKGRSASYIKGCFDEVQENASSKSLYTPTAFSTTPKTTPFVDFVGITTKVPTARTFPPLTKGFPKNLSNTPYTPSKSVTTTPRSTTAKIFNSPKVLFTTPRPKSLTTRTTKSITETKPTSRTTRISNLSTEADDIATATTKRSTNIFEFYLNGFKPKKISTIKWLFTTTPKIDANEIDSSASTSHLNTAKNPSSSKSSEGDTFRSSAGINRKHPSNYIGTLTDAISTTKPTTNPFSAFKLKNPFIAQHSITTAPAIFNPYFGTTQPRPIINQYRTLKPNNLPIQEFQLQQQQQQPENDQRPRSAAVYSTAQHQSNQKSTITKTTSPPTTTTTRTTALSLKDVAVTSAITNNNRSNQPSTTIKSKYYYDTNNKSPPLSTTKTITTSPLAHSISRTLPRQTSTSASTPATSSPTKRSIFDLYFDLFKH